MAGLAECVASPSYPTLWSSHLCIMELQSLRAYLGPYDVGIRQNLVSYQSTCVVKMLNGFDLHAGRPLKSSPFFFARVAPVTAAKSRALVEPLTSHS